MLRRRAGHVRRGGAGSRNGSSIHSWKGGRAAERGAQRALRSSLHQLRHTRGTELIEAGQRLEIVQRVLGHRDPRSTQRYAEVHDDVVRQALETGQ